MPPFSRRALPSSLWPNAGYRFGRIKRKAVTAVNIYKAGFFNQFEGFVIRVSTTAPKKHFYLFAFGGQVSVYVIHGALDLAIQVDCVVFYRQVQTVQGLI